MSKIQLPAFKGKPLIEIPKVVPTANFLEGDFGKAVCKEAKAIARSDYKNASALNIAEYEDNIVKGSNPFYAVLVNQIIRQNNLRTATQADLEKILEIGKLGLTGTYEDTALVLRSEEDPNKYLAKHLAEQIRKRNKELKYPLMIHLKDLELVNDSNSEYDLAFKLREDADVISSQTLAHRNNQRQFSKTDNNGLPIFSKDGERTFYTIDSGLSWLSLDRDLDLDSYVDDLANSNSNGRVALVSGEATSQNLDSYVAQLQQERDKQIAETDKKFQRAMKLLKE